MSKTPGTNKHNDAHADANPTAETVADPSGLREHLAGAEVWRCDHSGGGIRFFPMHYTKHSGSALLDMPAAPVAGYSAEDLATVDPRLPEALVYSSEHQICRADVLRMTLQLWNNELVELKGAMFNRGDMTYHADPTRMEMFVERMRDGESCLQLSMSFFNATVFTSPSNSLVIGSAQRWLALDNTWLDKKHPHWRATVLAADTMGASAHELAQMFMPLLTQPSRKKANPQADSTACTNACTNACTLPTTMDLVL